MNRQTNVKPAISRLRIKHRKGFPSRHSFTRSTRLLAYLSDLQEIVKELFAGRLNPIQESYTEL
jgi:hypothetical protein